jgi:hypothetical protein
VRQAEHHLQQHGRRLAALAVFTVLATVMFVYPRTSSIANSSVEPQQQRRRRTPGSNRRAPAQTSRRAGVNYSRFLHDNNHVKYDKANRANCSNCHTLNSPLQFDIKDYPDHPSCVNCHRQQFFVGARPVICTVCHKASSPRDERRFDFPKPNVDVTREFPGRFPHALHQDLLARSQSSPETIGAAAHYLVRTSSERGAAVADVRAEENCATCHARYDKTKKEEAGFFPAAGWPDNMLAGVGTFRKIPNGPEGHRTCFTCHASSEKGWSSPAPVANDCAGCHSKSAPAAIAAVTQPKPAPAGQKSAPPALASLMKVSFTNVLLPQRKVITFQHDGGGQSEGAATGSHDMACTVCHINITQAQTLIVRPDVPISSCAICHIVGGRKSSLKKGTDTTITSEMEAWTSGRKACLSCHTPEIGSRPPPCSHYYADKRQPPAELQCR